jgi:hypothetical protein
MSRARLQRIAPDLLAAFGLLALTLAIYLPYATEAGWYLDDWAVYAEEKNLHASFGALMTQCMENIPGGRKPACLYHVGEWWLFGDHRWAYHLCSIAFLVAIATLVYAIARRTSLGRWWCFAIAAAVIVFPGADSTRLWAVGSIGQYAIALQLAGLLLAVIALGRPPGRGRLALHLGAAFLALFAMATYEIVVPLVALQGLVYLAVYRNRTALLRWLVDLGLVLVFVVYRLTLVPVEGENFIAHRTLGELITRARVLLEGVWEAWRTLYAPGLALGLLAAIVVAAAAATVLSPTLRPRLLRWWLLLAGATVAAAAAALAYLTAEDLYQPVIYSTYNRVNLAGTIPYALAFVAVLGLLFELVRRWSPWALAAPLVVSVLALGVGRHQLAVSDEHQDAWLNSWSIQTDAIPGLRKAMDGVPTEARILGFDTPQWERDWVPVIVQTWDLRGLLAYETPVNPVSASPFFEFFFCGRHGVAETGTEIAPYDEPGHPLYFASPSRGRSVRIESKQQCKRMLKAWGYPPFWTPAAVS